jgi:LmbE family N-acetylglucosaminyl deacetylase
MNVLADHQVQRALVIIAHPDDAEFWAGGTIARWTDAGAAVTYLVLTDGDAGGFDPKIPRTAIPGIRRAEQEAAAAVLGVEDVRFLGLAEDDVRPHSGLRRDVVRVIRQVRPQRVITWSPEWNWQRFQSSHPNHRATGELALHAIYPDAGNSFAHQPLNDDEGLEAWTVPEIWLLHSPHANHYVDITDTFDRKVTSVRAHKSQVGHRERLAEALRARIAPNIAAAGLPPGRLAEAFQVVLNQ